VRVPYGGGGACDLNAGLLREIRKRKGASPEPVDSLGQYIDYLA
jgi:hypothetical protein